MTGSPSNSGKQPEVIDNGGRYLHADALRYLASHYPRPLAVATGYVNLGGLGELAGLDGAVERGVRLLLGAAPRPGLGDDTPVEEPLEAGRIFDETLKHLVAERDFDAFPPSRRSAALQRVDAFLARDQVQVRRYVQRFLHGKAYLFAASPALDQGAPSAALVTSANLTAAGMYANQELGLVHYQPNVVVQAITWFDELWEQAQDFKDELRARLFPTVPEYSPQQIFLRMLLEYYGDAVDEPGGSSDRLARFQRDGYRRALRIVQQHGGVLYADGVGTGKTHVGLEFINEYARRQGRHVLVISPAQLRDRNWVKGLHEANLPGEVISFQQLAMDEQLAHPSMKRRGRFLKLDKDVYRLVIVDEAHAFRSPDATYYHALNRLLGGSEKHLVLLTATPVNNALWDLYHQIMLFARHDAHFADDLGVLDLRKYFRDAGANDPESISAQALFPLMDAVTVRRDRRFLEKHYPNDQFADGTPVRFPKPQLVQRRYDLDAAFPGAFNRIGDAIGALKMARYQPESYRIGGGSAAGAQQALAALIQSGLLKRFESSLTAALNTVTKMLRMQDGVILACEQNGAVPSPSHLRDLYSEIREGDATPETVEEILDGDEEAIPLEELTDNYVEDLQTDRDLLAAMREDLEALAAQPDPKMALLREILASTPAKKVAIFTSFGDTARYIEEQLKDDPDARGGREMASVIGDSLDSDARQEQIERFAPKSVTGNDDATATNEVDLLLATDVISEGQNLQQAQAVISFDMPWNPQRVVQRNGRVIRLLSPHEEVYLYTMLPEKGELDSLLKLEAKLIDKIRAANASVGMESPVHAEVESEERTFADLSEYADRLARGDATILDEGEGATTGMFAGEEYRQLLARAIREGRQAQLESMPWGVGAAFVAHPGTPLAITLPAVAFAARDRRGKRHWRAVGADGTVVTSDLDLLRLADPAEQPRVAYPDAVDLETSWRIAATDICEAHNALLDPAARAVRLPASQRWAADLYLDPSLPQREDFERTYEALQVPRDQSVIRALSNVRREVNEGRRRPLDAAEEIARIVLETYGLQPARVEIERPYEITPDDLGVVAYQVVLSGAQ